MEGVNVWCDDINQYRLVPGLCREILNVVVEVKVEMQVLDVLESGHRNERFDST